MTPISRITRATRDELGQSVVELALILPLFVGILLGGADLARAYAVQLAVQNGARAAAESYAIDKTPTAGEATAAALAEINRTPTVNGVNATITVTEKDSLGVSPCPQHPPLVANPCYITVEVQYLFTTTIAWPLVPNQATFDRTTTFRMFY
jgi:Flp pilus assembly protein TadG